MLRPLLAGLLASLLLSGCTTPAPASQGAADAPTGTGSTPTGAAPSSPSSAPPASKPANATATPAQPKTTRFDGTRTAALQVPVAGDGASTDLPYNFHLRGNRTGVVIEMEWAPATPAASSMGFDVHRLGDETEVGASSTRPATLQATAAGEGPLRLALPDLPGGDYTVRARASGPDDTAGAAAAQDYSLWVTVFDGVPFDPAYVAPK